MADYDNNRPRRPENRTTRPVDGARRPADGVRRPVDGARRPVDGARRPVDGARRPVDGARRPADGTRRPADGVRRPAGAATSADGVRRAAENPRTAARRRPEDAARRPREGYAEGARRPEASDERRRRRLIAQQEEQAKKKKTAIVVIAIALVVLMIAGVMLSIKSKPAKRVPTGGNTGGDNPIVQNTNTPVPVNTSTPTPSPTPEPIRLNFCAVGDDLVHTGVFKAGHQADGSHDYTVLFKNTTYLMNDCDIKAINQETIFAGDDKGLQSYPSFNSPVGIADALVDCGFNVVTHATNHAFDMGLDGLLYSVSYWKSKHPDIFMVGIYENATEQAEIPIMEVKGVKIAMLNYTYSHNWETFSSEAEGKLNMLCAYDSGSRKIDFNTINPKVIEDIKKAEELADFTIVYPHWGTEYMLDPTDQQKNFAKLMTEAGADLIVGTHPHVIEPVEWVTADNGNECLCYYSLGNYTSTQDAFPRLLGGMAKLTIVKEGDKTYIEKDSAKAIPLVTHYSYPGWTGGTVVDTTYSLANYTEELAAAHGIKPRCGITVTKQGFVELANKVFGSFCSIE